MRPPPQPSQQPSQHHHNHHNNHQKSPVIPDHCCSCNNCNNYSSTTNINHQHSHNTTAAAPSTNEKDYYNLCECTSCRNLGNSIDICCQCCSCSAENYPRYHVASMAMQEDTLEVCLQQQTADSQPAHVVGGPLPHHATADDIALAHNMAERASAGCYECHSTNQGCCGGGGQPPAPRVGGQHARGPPIFHGWQQQQHHGQQGRRTLPKGHPAAAGHSCAGKGIFQKKKPVPPENVSLFLLIFQQIVHAIFIIPL